MSTQVDRGMHPVFRQFTLVEPREDGVFEWDELGCKTRALYCAGMNGAFDSRWDGRGPLLDQEYFEWVDVLSAVAAARESFTMVELGAGFGRWAVRGVMAARQRSLPARIIAVEPEPTHFKWLITHLEDNGVDDADLSQAAVASQSAWVNFHVGDPSGWYGQCIDGDFRQPELAEIEAAACRLESTDPVAGAFVDAGTRALILVPTTTLDELLDGVPHVDIIDLDVQGAEFDVLAGGAGVLDERVRLVHIGTHSRELEVELRCLFAGMGWTCRWDFPMGQTSDTPYGLVEFQDGVQSWLNPKFVAGWH